MEEVLIGLHQEHQMDKLVNQQQVSGNSTVVLENTLIYVTVINDVFIFVIKTLTILTSKEGI